MAKEIDPENRSFDQAMAGPAPDTQGTPPALETNWGIKGLAIEPGAVEKCRTNREARFDELPPSASTMFEKVEARLEQLVGNNDLIPAFWLEEGSARARAVCKIDAAGADYEGRTGSWSGTGFLVAPGILCTNHHVINSADVAERSRALFDFAALPDGRVRPVATFRLRPDLLFWTSTVVTGPNKGGLDVTFVAVDGEPGATFGSIPLLRQSFAVAQDDKLNIIQHPNGRLKEVALRDNTVTWQDARVVQYRSDTEAGSSGAPVHNDAWELVAIHHAAGDDNKSNEGIKFSAIATAIEQDAQHGDDSARQLIRLFRGTDELMGFFGGLGRSVSANAGGMERVADAYSGEDQDIDIGFWNIEWFNKRWQDKLDKVARIVVEMNLDVWVFVESSEEATKELAKQLADKYGQKWGVLASQDAPSERQITTVMWNKKTVDVAKKDWPKKVQRWFNVDSRSFGELGLEAVHGKVFDRYPALYQVKTKLSGSAAEFNLVPVHLKAMGEGSVRRQMASRLLAEAVAELAKDKGFDGDWIIGGDCNASLDSGDLNALIDAGLQPLTATDAADEQITYVKAPYKSLIDHIFVSRNLVPSDEDFVIVALDRSIERFLDVSDHRPILMRLAATGAGPTDPKADPVILSDDEVHRLTRGVSNRPRRGTGAGASEDALRRLGDRSVYYDEAADRAAREAYWQGINPASAGFTQALSALLEQTHTKRLSYEPSKHVYPWVDVRPNGKVQSIYSGFEADPEFFVQADAEVDRLRAEARSALQERGVLESTQLEAMLEAQFQYNCEHVVPQSWYTKQEPMRGDLHHLFSCEPRCNSFRSNFPLVQHELERTMQDCGRVEDETFEPKGGKGAVARATLYFMLRYPGVVGARYSGKRLETLLRWHRLSAPDVWELHRNAAIFVLQGNRNPLIDFPDWADKLQLGA